MSDSKNVTIRSDLNIFTQLQSSVTILAGLGYKLIKFVNSDPSKIRNTVLLMKKVVAVINYHGNVFFKLLVAYVEKSRDTPEAKGDLLKLVGEACVHKLKEMIPLVVAILRGLLPDGDREVSREYLPHFIEAARNFRSYFQRLQKAIENLRQIGTSLCQDPNRPALPALAAKLSGGGLSSFKWKWKYFDLTDGKLFYWEPGARNYQRALFLQYATDIYLVNATNDPKTFKTIDNAQVMPYPSGEMPFQAKSYIKIVSKDTEFYLLVATNEANKWVRAMEIEKNYSPPPSERGRFESESSLRASRKSMKEYTARSTPSTPRVSNERSNDKALNRSQRGGAVSYNNLVRSNSQFIGTNRPQQKSQHVEQYSASPLARSQFIPSSRSGSLSQTNIMTSTHRGSLGSRLVKQVSQQELPKRYSPVTESHRPTARKKYIRVERGVWAVPKPSVPPPLPPNFKGRNNSISTSGPNSPSRIDDEDFDSDVDFTHLDVNEMLELGERNCLEKLDLDGEYTHLGDSWQY